MKKKSLPSESAKKTQPAAKPAAKSAARSAPKEPAKATAKPATKPVVKAPAAKAAPVEPKRRFAVPMSKLKDMAKELGIKGVAKMDRQELIHAIQVHEGHAACYDRIPDCGQMDCLFRPDCLPEGGI